jgi:hypothetical protein
MGGSGRRPLATSTCLWLVAFLDASKFAKALLSGRFRSLSWAFYHIGSTGHLCFVQTRHIVSQLIYAAAAAAAAAATWLGHTTVREGSSVGYWSIVTVADPQLSAYLPMQAMMPRAV